MKQLLNNAPPSSSQISVKSPKPFDGGSWILTISPPKGGGILEGDLRPIPLKNPPSRGKTPKNGEFSSPLGFAQRNTVAFAHQNTRRSREQSRLKRCPLSTLGCYPSATRPEERTTTLRPYEARFTCMGLMKLESSISPIFVIFGLSLGTPGLFRVSGGETRPTPNRTETTPVFWAELSSGGFDRMFHNDHMVSEGCPAFK